MGDTHTERLAKTTLRHYDQHTLTLTSNTVRSLACSRSTVRIQSGKEFTLINAIQSNSFFCQSSCVFFYFYFFVRCTKHIMRLALSPSLSLFRLCPLIRCAVFFILFFTMYVLHIMKLALILTMGVFNNNNNDETNMYSKVSEYWQKFISKFQYVAYVGASHFFFLWKKRRDTWWL